MFSYLSPETLVRKDHPLREIRVMVDEILAQLSRRFDSMYASAGRPSIPPEKLLRAQLLQMLDSIRSERLPMLARHFGCAPANELKLAGFFSVCERQLGWNEWPS